jgi:lantibiotic modifying enzyme
MGWCYGDLGIAISFIVAGNIVRNTQLLSDGIETAYKTLNRKDLVINSVRDIGFCHGTVGIGHIYNRLFHYTGCNEFKEASKYWYLKTVEISDHKHGLKAWRFDQSSGCQKWEAEYGLLEGLAGVGLSLISSISEVEPKWDKILLLSK